MPDPADEQVTFGDPAEDEEAGSESDATTSSASPRSGEPDEAYKGLQRRLSAKDRQIADLTKRVQELGQQGDSALLSPTAQQAITASLQELAKHDQGAAQVLAQQIRQQFLEARNRELEDKQNRTVQSNLQTETEDRNLKELRAVAADIGADPDSSLVEYGDPSMYLYERMALVRESAKSAVKPATATPVKPTTSDGRAHNTQPGVPPAPKPRAKVYTQTDYNAALATYRGHPCAAHMAEAQKIMQAMQGQVEV